MIEHDISTPLSRGPRSALWWRAPARLAVLVALLAAFAGAPSPVRGFLLLPLALGVPTIAWARMFSDRLKVDAQIAGGLGLIMSLASWSLVELVMLGCRVPVTYRSAGAALLVTSVVPLVTNRPLASVRSVLASERFDSSRARRATARLVPILVVFAVGAVLVARSVAIATRHPDSRLAFAVFWAGLLSMSVPLFVAAAAPNLGARTWVLVLLGVATYVPTFVRSPWKPNLLDELGHWGETNQLLTTPQLFQPDSVVRMGPRYPGLETLTVGLARLSGWSMISVGHAVILLCHIASVFGVVALFKLVGGSSRWAVLAAAIYAVGPSYLQIDTLYSYESFALPLAIWSIFVAFLWARASDARARGLALLTVVISATLVVTHHLTTFLEAAILIVGAACCGLASWRRRRRRPELYPASDDDGAERIRRLVIAGVATALAATIWAFAVHAPLVTYLGVFPRAAIAGVSRFLGGSTNPVSNSVLASNANFGQPRSVFGGSLLPNYERILSFAAQPIMFVWFCLAAFRIRRRLTGARLLFGLIGAAYFLSLPLTLLGGAAAGAHRSWAISFIGLAVVLPLTFDGTVRANEDTSAVANAARRRRPSAHSLQWLTTTFVAGSLTAILVGSYAAAVSAYQQFPGPFVLGADGRTVTPDMIRSAEWFRATEGPGQVILTNRRTLAVFGAYADAQTRPFLEWLLFYPPTPPDAKTSRDFLGSGIGYVIVDRRLAEVVPIESYFASWEPNPPSVPLPAASLTKFNETPWLSLVHRDGNISIYKVVKR